MLRIILLLIFAGSFGKDLSCFLLCILNFSSSSHLFIIQIFTIIEVVGKLIILFFIKCKLFFL